LSYAIENDRDRGDTQPMRMQRSRNLPVKKINDTMAKPAAGAPVKA